MIKTFTIAGRISIPKFLKFLLITFGLVSALHACSPGLTKHGQSLDPEIIKSIRIGKTNRQQVAGMLGIPSAISTFDQETWYYIGSKIKQIAFFKPDTVERKILVIRFGIKGIVKQLERLDSSDGRKIKIVKRKTPTRGKELTVIQQIIGNVGKFGTGKEQAGPAGL